MSYMGKVRPTIALLTDDIADDQVTSAKIADTTIVNADVNASAAIAQTKVALDITNSEVNASAAIAKTKLASLDVVNADVNASAGIVGSKLADNAITLAKMEDGTQGDILYYGASGAPTRLGFGTSGDFLKTQGTGANPVWAAISAADNTPAFLARLSAAQNIANATWEKLNVDTEIFDTDSAYDNSTNYRFTVPSGEAGVYVFYFATTYNSVPSGGRYTDLVVYVNGTFESVSPFRSRTADSHIQHDAGTNHIHTSSSMMNMSVGDYVELWTAHNSGSAKDATSAGTYFGGMKLAGVNE